MINIKDTKKEFLKILDKQKIDSVLDLGCGVKPLSMFFAKKGCKVTGVDNVKRDHSEENFKFIQANIPKNPIKKSYDLIISSMILHHFRNRGAPTIIKWIQNATNKNGFNLIICMSNKDNYFKEENFYPSLNELKRLYSAWKVIKIVSGKTESEQHGKEEKHHHNLIFALFQNSL